MARRLAHCIDPDIVIEPIRGAFPAADVIAALKGVDIVVACVDTFAAREQLNEFCRRYHIPYVDIGVNIETVDDRLSRAAGQLVVVTPDSPCIRCLPVLSSAILEGERRRRPPGYDLNPDAVGDPQVVSMNGTLASEACNAVLDLLTGYAGGGRGPGWWQYDGRKGELTRVPPRSRRVSCPACAQWGHGDPSRR
jgi:molybdopterin-synthase adenylyltransferase